MKIIGITSEKGKLNRVELEDGETLWLHTDLLVSEHLKVGTELPPERIEEIAYAAALHRSYEYALYCLERRAYSYRELYQKLMSAKNPNEEAVQETLEKLLRLGLLDDAKYAQSLARLYVETRHYGARRAAYEMLQKGLSQTDIADALAPYEDSEQVSAQLQELLHKKYARQLTDADDRKAIERVTASLVRRGFRYQDIRYALEDYFAEYE